MTDTPPARRRLAYVPALDGLRGLAVAAAVAFHAGYRGARGGFLGVSAFFTLSGFLITSLLLAEHHARGTLDLRSFWARRARRLLPASLLTLAGVVVYGATLADAGQLRSLRGDVLAALGNVANWRFHFAGRSYADLFEAPSPVLHFWSLSIEEQCYLALPLLLVVLLRVGRGRQATVGAGVALLAAASVGVSVLVSGAGAATSRAYYGTDTRAAELLIGALVAVLVAGRQWDARRSVRVAVAGAGSAALAAMVVLWAVVTQADGRLYDGGFAAHALLASAVVLAAHVPGPVRALLALRPLVALGRVSYGVYLFHWPVFLWLSPERTGWSGTPLFGVRVAVTLVLAAVSFRVVEQPIRHGARLTAWRPRVAVPAVAVAVVGALVAVTASPPAPEIVFEPRLVSEEAPVAAPPPAAADGVAARTSAARPETAPAPPAEVSVPPRVDDLHRPLDTDRPLRVLVVGDSVGVTLGRGLEQWGRETGRAVVWNQARPYCAIGRGALRTEGAGEHDQPACDDWAERWASYVRDFDPDAVVVLSTFWELIARRHEAWDDWAEPGDRVLDDWQLGEYEAAVDVLGAQGARVVWLTVPCMGVTAEERKSEPVQILRYNEHQLGRLAAARRDAVRVVDLFGPLCPDDRYRAGFGDVADARPDGAHFSDVGARAVAGWLGPLLEDGRPVRDPLVLDARLR